jgi:endonuclease III
MPVESKADKQKRFDHIVKELTKLYPEAHCALDYTNAFELLTATILSAQCTDARVNIVMKDVRRSFPNPKALSQAELEDIEDVIRTTGFFRQKAKSLKSMATDIVEKFGGEVPETMDELTTLRGVGRKTANVVLGNAFGKAEGIAVDTHVTRLTNLLKLTKHTDAEKIEQDLMLLSPQKDWTMLTHLLISHGRAICIARRPKCGECTIAEFCPSAFIDK